MKKWKEQEQKARKKEEQMNIGINKGKRGITKAEA
jgi:hypothetical protein